MSRLRLLVLNTGALLGGLCLLAVVALWMTGSRPLVVQSDSMAPEIASGDLLVTRSVEAADLEVGDVVSVVDEAGVRVTHRIVELSGDGAERLVRLRGDANAVTDPEAYTLGTAERVAWVLPGVGRVAAFVDSTPGRSVAVGLVALCWLAVALPRRTPAHARRARRRGVAPVLVGAALVLPVVLPASQAWAIFDDAGTVTTGELGAHRVVPQPQPTCDNEGGLLGIAEYARLSWTHADPRYDYRWEVRHTSSGRVVRSGSVQPGPGDSGVLEIRTSVLDLHLGVTTYDVVIHARLRAAPTWEAAGTTTRVRTAVLGVLGVRCA